jgi:hypothetical protein
MEGIEDRLLDIAVYAKLGRLIVRSIERRAVVERGLVRATFNPDHDAQLEFDFGSLSDWT